MSRVEAAPLLTNAAPVPVYSSIHDSPDSLVSKHGSKLLFIKENMAYPRTKDSKLGIIIFLIGRSQCKLA